MVSANPLLFMLRLAVVATVVLGGIAAVFVCENAVEIGVCGLGLACLAVVAVPLFTFKEYSLFEPATFVVLLVLFGTPLKLVYMVAADGQNYHVSNLLLNWEGLEVFVVPLLVVLVAWVFYVVGYSLPLSKGLFEACYLPSVTAWNQRRLAISLIGLSVLSLLFLLAFMFAAGVSIASLEGLSAKRFSEDAGSSADRINSSKYYLYRGAALSKFVVYFGLAWMICRRDRLASWTGLLFVLSLFQTVFLSFVINNRAGIVLVVVDCLVIAYYLRGVISPRVVVLGVLAVGALLIPALISRGQSETTTVAAFEKTFAGRDMLDIAKTCHIINAVPAKMDYRYGEMLYGWMAAPIPRSVWPDKPMWAERGAFINQNVFGDKWGISGVPPGLLAELYWNFGLLGTWLGMLALGRLLRQLFVSFRPSATNPTSVLIYTLLVTRFGMFALGNDFGTGIVKTALDVLPVCLILGAVGVVRTREDDSLEAKAESL